MFGPMTNVRAMGTPAQNAANRRNAQKSTGPTSREGKVAAAANALRHGSYASTATAIPRGRFAEKQGEVDEYVQGLVDALAPRDGLEHAQANRVAHYFLQCRRLRVFESEALAGDTVDDVSSDIDVLAAMVGRNADDLGAELAALRALNSAFERVTRIDTRIGRSLERALIVYYELRKRTPDSEFGETNPILTQGA